MAHLLQKRREADLEKEHQKVEGILKKKRDPSPDALDRTDMFDKDAMGFRPLTDEEQLKLQDGRDEMKRIRHMIEQEQEDFMFKGIDEAKV